MAGRLGRRRNITQADRRGRDQLTTLIGIDEEDAHRVPEKDFGKLFDLRHGGCILGDRRNTAGQE